jgi:outer membrane immunogenic protein
MYARLVGAALAVLCTVTFALAADKGQPNFLDPPKETSDYGWNRSTGYVGAAGGYDVLVLDAEDLKLGDGKLIGCAFAGYNYRAMPRLIVGIEGDYCLTNIAASATDEEVTVKASTDFLASIRGRVGIPFGPALLFLTGGAAFTEQKVSVSDGPSDSEFLTGLVAGGGIEAELTQNLFVKLEALHYMFPDKAINLVEMEDVKLGKEHTVVRVGVGFKLN